MMKVPHFPHKALPGLLGSVLNERSNTPKDDAIGASVLEAVSALVSSGLAVYDKPEGGTAPLTSFGILLAPSGAGKSFHYGPLTAAITRWCSQRATQVPMDRHQQQAAHRVWKKRVRRIEDVIKECLVNGEGTQAIEALLANELAQEPRPIVPQALLHDDVSVQALLRSLEQWPVSGWIVDEGAVALSMLRTKDFPTLANLSSGKVIQHGRVGEPRMEIRGFLTTLFMVQPSLFNAFCKKRGDELKASGLDARFLYHIVLDKWTGSEDPDDVKIGHAHEQYDEHVTAMLDELDACIRTGKKDPSSVALSRGAKAILRELQERNLSLMAQPDLAHCRDFLAKLTGHIARMAAKNHVFLGREGDVAAELVEMAEQVCWYHFEAYQWMHNPLEHEPRKVQDAATLVQWMLDHRERRFAYSQISKVAMVIGMTATRLRSAIGELLHQGRARMLRHGGEDYIELLPPPGSMERILGDVRL